MAANTVKKTSVKKTAAGKSSGQKASGRGTGKQSAKASPAKTRQAAKAPVQTQTGENPLIVREAVLWLILAACVFIFISYFGVGGFIGSVISDVSFGVFGAAAYLFPFLIFIAAAFLISNKGNKTALIKFFSAVFLYLCVSSFTELIINGYQKSVTDLHGKCCVQNRRRDYRRLCLFCTLSGPGDGRYRSGSGSSDDYLCDSHYPKIAYGRAAQTEPACL